MTVLNGKAIQNAFDIDITEYIDQCWIKSKSKE